MTSKFLITILLSLFTFNLSAQENVLTKKEIAKDLKFLTKALNEKSSYVYLNGYDFNPDFEKYLNTIGDSTQLEDFGLFLTETLGKIGDRHLSMNGIRGYDLDESLFLPFMYAPCEGKVVVLNRGENKELEILLPEFPYLKKIDGMPIGDFLEEIRPEHVKAPEEVYFTQAVRDIRDIQKNYKLLNKSLPEEVELTLTDATFKNDTVLVVAVVDRSKRSRPWDEKFESEYVRLKDEDYNKPEVIDKLFEVREGIAYIHIPEMADIEEAPLLFDSLNVFMKSIQNTSTALIIDVRSNSGGTRDLIYEFEKYLVPPDSVYVVNVTQQRGPIPLPKAYKSNLNTRFLYPYAELDSDDQSEVNEFLKTFKPMYTLDDEKYSEYYFGLLKGESSASTSLYYNKPVYILANEKTFSAASVFVSVYKGIPNVEIVGVRTDGSSGNSEWIDLPKSELFGKISTMVSFQKDGIILDGFGTEPDIKSERDMEQILWKSDTQLENLRSSIRADNQ